MLKPYNKAEVIFDFIREIGAVGQNSRTYLSHDHQLDAEIVTKQIDKLDLDSPDNFFDESKALYASAHPNVVQIHYACQDDDYIYIAMPYYRKGSVTRLITDQHMTVREIVTIGCQVLSGLHNIHSKKLIHFDVKPDNILLSARGEALLSDFGLAKQMNFSGIAGQDRLYFKMTPPEATLMDQFDSRFDIFQFGLTLYRMCNGNAEFYAQFAKYGPPQNVDRNAFRYDIRNGLFPDRKLFAPHIPSKLRKIVQKCIQTDPAQRFQSALEVANALAQIDGNTLDWRLAEIADKKVWSKNENGTIYEFTVLANGGSECYKTVRDGQPRRVIDGCRMSISANEIKKFLGDY